MSLNQSFIGELEQEAKNTKKILERVPFEKRDWKPHEKSTPLGRLATHIAELPRVISGLISTGEFDVAGPNNKPGVVSSTSELFTVFDENHINAVNVLRNVTDDELMKDCILRRGERIIYTMPKIMALRPSINHIIHHRGQLSVYLRLLNVPLPFIYGPTADEPA